MADRHEFDLIIIGSGISGLASAITAAENGLKTAVFSKEKELAECNTFYAQGGIVGHGMDDSPALLESDIIRAGDNLNCVDTVRLLTREGPDAVDEFLLKKIKVPFDRNEGGKIDRTMEAAHSVRRILHVKDRTGESVEASILKYAEKTANLKLFKHHVAIDIITNTHNSVDTQERYKTTRVIGAYIYDEESDSVNIFFAPSVIIATGGIGNLYLHTSNPTGATGDGIAMAERIGAEIINSEYIQFHPTILYDKDVKRFLITEALRGEGARLMNKEGEYFMERYSKKLKDLAPRDEVSRAIFSEMERVNSDYVFLDATHIKNISLKDRFPQIYSKCMDIGLDINHTPIPVVPAAHYFCGGIKVDSDGKTSVPGLFAVGEAACTGVHGANRLASISLLEGLYFGIRAANFISRSSSSIPKSMKDNTPDWIFPKNEEEFDPILISQDLLNIQTTMWNYAGIIRNNKRLSRALSDLNYLSHRVEKFYNEAKITRAIIELRNSVLTATIIVQNALSNRISRGCHFIIDH
ncbi:MAG: L-aspartate oxidase [Spirochaetales bacterium]|nr:L-aspartate oxidase [Spirochaetales bacterium]